MDSTRTPMQWEGPAGGGGGGLNCEAEVHFTVTPPLPPSPLFPASTLCRLQKVGEDVTAQQYGVSLTTCILIRI